MAAYVLADVTINDPSRYEEYKALAGAALKAYGGRFLVRGGPTETLEGSWVPNRLVVIEFDSLERAKEWYASGEYRPALELRQAIADTGMILVEGA